MHMQVRERIAFHPSPHHDGLREIGHMKHDVTQVQSCQTECEAQAREIAERPPQKAHSVIGEHPGQAAALYVKGAAGFLYLRAAALARGPIGEIDGSGLDMKSPGSHLPHFAQDEGV